MKNAYLILICGLPGTGKTSVAQSIQNELQWPIVSTEVIRSRLFNKIPEKQDIDFTLNEIEIVYETTCLIAEFLTLAHTSVIVEGVFRSEQYRRKIDDLCIDKGTEIIKVYLTGNIKSIQNRLGKRQKQANIAPAGPKTVLKIQNEYEPIDPSFMIFDSTTCSITKIVKSILKVINDRR